MKWIYSSSDVTEVGYYKSILDEYKIPCFIQNENTATPILGGSNYYPALCVLNDADFEKALQILKSREVVSIQDEPEWTCRECGEVNPGTFDSCWQCETSKPTASG